MRRARTLRLVCAVCLFASSPEAASDPIVLSVGDTSLRASQLSARLAAVPPFQLRTFGETPDQIRRRFIETAVVPELLFAAEARSRKLHEIAAVKAKVRDVYRRLIQADIRRAAQQADPPTEAEIRAYYEQNLRHFVTPERVQIWRILVTDEPLARKIIASVQGVDGPEKWNQLAREHSVDPATRMRSGNLGFVDKDGQSHIPQLRVDTALFAAAKSVKDGEIVPQPIKEGDRFAVVWRRGTLERVERPLATEKPAIAQMLNRRKQFTGTQALLEKLAKQHVSEKHPELLTLLPRTQPEPAASNAPPVLPRSVDSVLPPAPTQTPAGLR